MGMGSMVDKPARPVAHTPPEGTQDWHYLDQHSTEVADLAKAFADRFGAGAVAWWLGLLHDIAKALAGFQSYLWRCYHAQLNGEKAPKSDTPHAAPGAAFAEDFLRKAGQELRTIVSIPIHGHHTHLEERKRLSNILKELRATGGIPFDVIDRAFKEMVANLPSTPPRMDPAELTRLSLTQLELRTRMLLSALIDADRISTSAHFQGVPIQASAREVEAGDLGPALFEHIEQMRNDTTELGRIRHNVYEWGRKIAREPGGIFRLTVPTGGGKTLSSLAFALERLKGCDGIVVVALPYTSIIQQTAKVYREITGIGDRNVLEHHSAVAADDRDREDPAGLQSRLITENWDVPIVVTTTVQLLESLFSNRPSKVRKLHRLAGSVIILDEFQSLPPALLAPTMDVLKELATPVDQGGYGATVVLCTATQPTLDSPQIQSILEGVEIKEIVPHYAEHFEKLKRVDYRWRPDPLTWGDVSEELSNHDSALVVLNTRRDALALLHKMRRTEHLFHLSTLLCGAHRQHMLAAVHQRLDAGLPVKLVSTQVVECGVDFDFPVVYRAVGPLDRIVQAAGRCNRNFKLDTPGEVVIFEPADGATPKGLYEQATNKTVFVMNGQDPNVLHDPDFHSAYFHKLFNDLSLDERHIQTLREQLDFPTVAEKYRLIDSPTSPVVVQYGDDWEKHLNGYLQRPNRRTWQALQPYVVNLFDFDIKKAGTSITEVEKGLHLSHGPYHKLRGIDLGDGIWDPSDLYVG